MKYEQDLIEEIRTFTYFDVQLSPLPHSSGYGYMDNKIDYPEITDCNRYNLLNEFNKIRDTAKTILEIGVGVNEESLSSVLIRNKKKDTVYVGLDIEDRSFLRDPEKNIHTIQNDSSRYDENVNIIKSYFNIEKFDVILIDGLHTINQILMDWEYTNLLSNDGIVIFRGTTCNPGPKIFIDYIDRNKWKITENKCPKDYGISFIKKYE